MRWALVCKWNVCILIFFVRLMCHLYFQCDVSPPRALFIKVLVEHLDLFLIQSRFVRADGAAENFNSKCIIFWKCSSAAGTLWCIMSAAMNRAIFRHTCTSFPGLYMCFTFSLRLDFRGKFPPLGSPHFWSYMLLQLRGPCSLPYGVLGLLFECLKMLRTINFGLSSSACIIFTPPTVFPPTFSQSGRFR